MADLGDPGAPVALPHAAIPLLRPRHWIGDECALARSEGAALLSPGVEEGAERFGARALGVFK